MKFMNIFNYICHRKPERSFFFRGHQFPVCARCTGIYIIYIPFCLLNFFITFIYNDLSIILAILLIIPTFIDGFTQLKGYRESNNFLRFTTGMLAGLGLGILTIVVRNILSWVLYYSLIF